MMDFSLSVVEGFPAAVAAWLITYLIHSSILLGGGLLGVRLIPSYKWSRLREILLKAALVGGILTSTLAVTILPSVPSLNIFLKMRVDPNIEQFVPGAGDFDIFTEEELSPASFSHVDINSISRNAFNEFKQSQSFALRWPKFLFFIWLAAGFLLCLEFLKRWIQLRSILKRQNEIRSGPLRELVNSIKKKIGFKKKIILRSIVTPKSLFVMGRREICLSEEAFSLLNKYEQSAVLAHEMAHLLRYDHQWLMAVELIRKIFFFQPLNFIVARYLIKEMEFLCDEYALILTKDPAPLARSLVKFAYLNSKRCVMRLPFLLEGKKTIFLQRAKRILQWNPSQGSHKIPVVFVTLFVTLFILAAAKMPKTELNLLCDYNSEMSSFPGLNRSENKQLSEFFTMSGTVYGNGLTAQLKDCTIRRKPPFDFYFLEDEGSLSILKIYENGEKIFLGIHRSKDGSLKKSFVVNGNPLTFNNYADILLKDCLNELLSQ